MPTDNPTRPPSAEAAANSHAVSGSGPCQETAAQNYLTGEAPTPNAIIRAAAMLALKPELEAIIRILECGQTTEARNSLVYVCTFIDKYAAYARNEGTDAA